jgi:hypothetical protein
MGMVDNAGSQRRKPHTHLSLLVGVITAIVVVAALYFASSASEQRCALRPDDPQGYLLMICQYITAHKIDVSPANPQTYHVREMHEVVENQRQLVVILLDCCYTGDRAWIDLQTSEVIRFQLGNK